MQAEKLQPDRHEIMQGWARRFQRWQIHQLAAAFLEAGGPLNLVGAQLVYLGQPVIGSFVPPERLETLAEMLEKPTQTKQFIRYLREEAQ